MLSCHVVSVRCYRPQMDYLSFLILLSLFSVRRAKEKASRSVLDAVLPNRVGAFFSATRDTVGRKEIATAVLLSELGPCADSMLGE